MGASMALAGFGLNSCRRPEAHLVPFTKSVEWAIPGKPLYYATAMPRRNGAMPLVVTTDDGRPIKIEGNPLHPASGGATDAFAQASLLDLYDPARSKRFVQSKRQDCARSRGVREISRANCARRWRPMAAPVSRFWSRKRIRRRANVCAAELEKQFPQMRWCVYDPLLTEAQTFRHPDQFWRQHRGSFRSFDQGRCCSRARQRFPDCGEGDLAVVRGFTSRRRVREAKDTMNRLYVVENRFTLTGAMADHRLRCPASQIPAFTHALAEQDRRRDQGPGPRFRARHVEGAGKARRNSTIAG